MLRRRALGRTGLYVSEIGFGAWGIGGVHEGATSYGPADDATSERALRQALDCGVNLFDTADLYGHGHSETLLGRVFRRERANVVIASKVGFLDAAGAQNFSASHIRASFEASLRRLQTDYLDVYQLHNPPLDTMSPDDPAFTEMRQLRRHGRIRAFGISLRGPADGIPAIETFGAEVVQVNFNMIDQRAQEHELFDLCARREVGLILRTPLCYGFLTGKYDGQKAFGEGDHRRNWSDAQRGIWADAPRLFEPIRARENQTAGQLALRFCLSYSQISTVIPGMLTPAQVDENVGASLLGPLTSGDRLEIEELYRGRRFFLGRDAVARAAASP